MNRTLIVACAALALSACATVAPVPTSYPIERAAATARASHALTCGAVESGHATGALSGVNFNRAKLLCIQSDAMLDVADAAVIMGDAVTAAAKVAAANAALTTVKSLSPPIP